MGNEEIMQEAQGITEEALETIERTLDSMEDAKTVVKNNPYIIAGAAIIGIGIGFAIGYKVAYKKLEMKFDDLLDEEVAKTKDFYAAFHKKDEFSTPESAAAALIPAEERVVHHKTAHTTTATEAIKMYTGQDVNIVGANNPLSAPSIDEEIDVVVEETVVSTNIFLNGEEITADFDPEAELAHRDRTRPYVISKDEFFENITDAEVSSLTWYAGDTTLVPDDDEMTPVQDTDAIVGDDSLQRFGHGSEDSQVVYVRNEVKGAIYEIVRSKGSYASEVLGFDDEEIEISKGSTYAGGGRKFRRDDDG